MSKRDLVLPPVVREFKMTENPVCHNCCHDFWWGPVKIPTPYKKSYGHFCSYGCALRYLISFDEIRYAGDVSNLIYECNSKTLSLGGIKLLPPRICLTMFGGPLSIQDYRDGKECGVGFNGSEYYYVV